jgi:hypothetical protein
MEISPHTKSILEFIVADLAIRQTFTEKKVNSANISSKEKLE